MYTQNKLSKGKSECRAAISKVEELINILKIQLIKMYM
jgi:hypothetical protein